MRIFTLFFVLVSVFFFLPAYAQETTVYAEGRVVFMQQYNNAAYEALFATFSPEMKEALPYEKTVATFSSLLEGRGKILEMAFIRYENTFARYKTTFEKGVLEVHISFDGAILNGLLFTQYKPHIPAPERNTTQMRLPFKGKWYVFWGGDTKEQNYHVEYPPFKNAFDFVIVDEEGKSYRSKGKTNDEYYAFNQKLYAPCDGEVVLVVDGIKDNVPGMMDPYFAPGNTVIIKTTNKEYIVLCHFKQWSIRVKQGQKVKTGKYLGRCGNSGNSSEPHLHFHIQNVENINFATGIKCYFELLSVEGAIKKDYSPVQKEIVEHIQ